MITSTCVDYTGLYTQSLWSRSSIFQMAVLLHTEMQKRSNAPILSKKLTTKVSKSHAIPPYVPRVNPLGWPLISALHLKYQGVTTVIIQQTLRDSIIQYEYMAWLTYQGSLVKSECMQFCLPAGVLNNVLYVFLLKFASFSRYYVCKKLVFVVKSTHDVTTSKILIFCNV